MHTADLSLAEARAIVAGAVDKAEDLGVRGALAVVGGSGALVSASRMDRGGAGGMARARSKAWIAATQQMPSVEHLRRMTTLPPPMERGFAVCSPEAAFPGAGGMPIRRPDGVVVGGIAASGATVGPFVDYPGADPQKLIADGRPANCEDLLVHYALGMPYEGQHGDDRQRWIDAYGSWPEDPGSGLGMADPSPAREQAELAWAVALADRAIAEAERLGVRASVAIVDHRGEAIQLDRMDDAPAAGIAIAEATAAAAATFQVPSRELASRYSDQALDLLARTLPFGILPAPGGLPLLEHDRVVGGIGVGGPEPEACEQIAAAAAGAGVPA